MRRSFYIILSFAICVLAIDPIDGWGQTGITSVKTGNGPEGLTTADFNRDGVTDLVVANAGDGNLSVFLTGSRGAVLARTDFRVGSGPVATQAADLDGDKDLDLVAANQAKRTVSILFNDSRGVFGPASDLFANGPVGQVALADFDGDGDVDIAATDGAAGVLLIYRNSGRGSYESPVSIPIVSGISDLAAVDLNGDGIPDLVILSHLDERMALLTNQGNGAFGIDLGNTIGIRPSHLAWSDFDADGDLDLAASTADARVLVFDNHDGFNRNNLRSYSLADTASALVAADLDLDLYPDLLAPCATGEITALVNDGNGAFLTSLSFGSVSEPGDATVADLNSDGQYDVVVAVPGEGSLRVFTNRVARSLKDPAPPQDVTAIDVPADLGDNALLSWKRPRRDESTGRILAYRIMRALSSDDSYSEITRVGTLAPRSLDSVFVYRSYVDSNATLGVSYSYYLQSEGVRGTLSAPSDTIKITTRAQPFFDFSFSGNSPYHIRDTVVATVRLNLLGHDVQSFSLFMGFDTTVVRILDRDASTPGTQPLFVDPKLAANASVLQNRIDPLNRTRVDFGLGFLPTLPDSIPIHVGTLLLVGRKNATSVIQVLNDTLAARQTVLTNRSDGTLIRPFVPAFPQLVFRNFPISGSIRFQGRDIADLAIRVRLDLTQNKAQGTALTTPYVASNDADRNAPGIQLTLNAKGQFVLPQVPPGKYSLFAKSFHYLRGRISRDSVVVTDSIGVASPVTFKFVSADSALRVAELRGGDANNDNRIDLADFGVLVTHFGTSGFGASDAAWRTDFNGDGVINLADFALLQSNFGEVGMGSAIATKPIVLTTRLVFAGGLLRIENAEKVVGVSVDIIGDVDANALGPGDFWGDRAPMILMRQMNGSIRIAAVSPKNELQGTGTLFVAPSLGSVRLERMRILTVDGVVAWAGDPQISAYNDGYLVPDKPELYVNYPNPFNPSTTIPFVVSPQTQVLLTVYSPLGQLVRTLVRDVLPAGYHELVWDGRDREGRAVASGLYIIRLVQDDFVATRKALLIK